MSESYQEQEAQQESAQGASTADLQRQMAQVLDKLYVAAQPGAVFGQPVVSGAYTVITASEIAAGGGFGYGGGTGPAARAAQHHQEGEPQARPPMAGGNGGGGGGGSRGRPVAVIVIGPDGVRVRPVVDATKVALAALTAWGAVAIALGRMARRSRGREPRRER